MRNRRYAAEGALVLAAFFFGSTFVLVQDAIEDITPLGYLVVRFSVGALALAPFAVRIARRDLSQEGRRLLWRVGTIAGVLLFAGYAFQTIGLQYTESSTSAFLTGLYAIFTPMVESVARRRVPPTAVCAGIVVATVGLFLLTGADLEPGKGELLTLACAISFAIWIVYQGGYVSRLHPVPLSAVQLGVVALVAIPPTAATGVGRLSALAIFAGVVTGIVCSSVALSLQLYGQSRLSPSRSALILLMEPVFAGIIGFLHGERLGAARLIGAAIILAGIAVAELSPGRAAEDAAARIELGRAPQ